MNRNESSVCLKASCLARNWTLILTHNNMKWWYEMHHNTSWQKRLLGNQSSVVNRHFWKCYRPVVIRFCSIHNEPMCLRPYPVYIKMWTEAKEIICELCVRAVHSLLCAQKNRAALSGLIYLVWPKLEEWADKKIIINKIKWHLRETCGWTFDQVQNRRIIHS